MKTGKTTKFNISKLLFIFFGFITAIPYNASATSIVIVKNHEPNAVIVLPDSASQSLQNAAKLLQNYIQQSTGALLPINNDVQGKNVSIDIGLTSYVKKQKLYLKNID